MSAGTIMASAAGDLLLGCAGAPPRPGGKAGGIGYFARFGVTELVIAEALGAALSRGGDYADVFFQHRVSNDLALEDGAVNRAFTTVELGVGVRVRNTGSRAGAEVVQLYLHDVQSSLPRPPKELKAFARVMLQPGEARTIHFSLDESALAFFDPGKGDWLAEKGAFEVLVGASSRDIRLRGSFSLVD